MSTIESLNSSFYNFDPSTAASDSENSNEVDFLQLMLTQMQNQDPLNPMESGDFLAQLAQFETASGMTDLQNSFENMVSIFQSSQALEASTLVGRSVLISGNVIPVNEGEEFKGAVNVQSGASSVTVGIYKKSGELVHELTYENPDAGLFDYSWDGKDAEGNQIAEGTYIAQATGNYNGENYALNTFVEGRVDSVSLNTASGSVLNLSNDITVSIDDVTQVRN